MSKTSYLEYKRVHRQTGSIKAVKQLANQLAPRAPPVSSRSESEHMGSRLHQAAPENTASAG